MGNTTGVAQRNPRRWREVRVDGEVILSAQEAAALAHDGGWKVQAVCRSPWSNQDDFFASEQEEVGGKAAGALREAREGRAVATCRTCPVMQTCRSVALAHAVAVGGTVAGVWGGLTEEEQRALVRKARRAAGDRRKGQDR